MDARSQRLTAVSGLVFVALVVASIIAVPNAPDAHTTAAKDVAFYSAHKSAAGVAAHLIVLAVVVGLFFFWHLRDFLATTAATKRLATIGFAGAVVFAACGGVAAASYYTLSDAIGHADASTIQVLNLMQSDFSDGVGEAGIAAFLLASSVAIIRARGPLPSWVGWIGIVLGVGSALVIGLGLPALALWLLIACVTMIVRAGVPSGVRDLENA
jgi:hypothetical protein